MGCAASSAQAPGGNQPLPGIHTTAPAGKTEYGHPGSSEPDTPVLPLHGFAVSEGAAPSKPGQEDAAGSAAAAKLPAPAQVPIQAFSAAAASPAPAAPTQFLKPAPPARTATEAADLALVDQVLNLNTNMGPSPRPVMLSPKLTEPASLPPLAKPRVSHTDTAVPTKPPATAQAPVKPASAHQVSPAPIPPPTALSHTNSKGTSVAANDQEAEPASSDPWSSLQSQYAIREDAAVNPERPSSRDGVPTPVSNGHLPKPGSMVAGRMRGSMARGGDGSEIVVDDDDDGFFSTQSKPQEGRVSGRASRPLPAAKQGGWGQGELATAGTLMLGQEELQSGPRDAGISADMDDEPSYGQLEVPRLSGNGKPQPVANDLEFEELDDVDALIEEEMQGSGIQNKELAAKLAAFEARQDDD